jgi:hypothetical protein
VVILGGDHADVPINESAGAAVGEMVATQQMQVIVDLSRTTLGERRRFVEHFAERVFEKNRGVLHSVVRERSMIAWICCVATMSPTAAPACSSIGTSQ